MQADLSGLRIGLLTASASRLGGGVFEAVAAQAALIRNCGGHVSVFALDDAFAAEDCHRFAPAPVHHGRVLGPPQIGYAPDLLAKMLAADLDCLHLHGIWMYPSRAGYLWQRRTGRPYLISPHGMLDPWITARGRWKKALARAGYERSSWRSASRLHALTRREARDIETESGRGDSVVIANPGPALSGDPAAPRGPRFLCLGRIHPKKNIGALVEAWRQLDAAGSLPAAAQLTIAGWGEEAHVEELREALAGAPQSVQFTGPVFGAEKQRLLGSASFLVLPSLSEGLPMVVLEAWAAGTPVLMTQECNLPEGFDGGAAIDCGYTPATIAECLRSAISTSAPEWSAMSSSAHDLAGGPFSAQVIAGQWQQTYRELILQTRGGAPGDPA